MIGSQLAGGAPCHGLYFEKARLVCAGGPSFMARAALRDGALGRGVEPTYTLGDRPTADELRSLVGGDKAVQYICAPRGQSLLYGGEKRLPR